MDLELGILLATVGAMTGMYLYGRTKKHIFYTIWLSLTFVQVGLRKLRKTPRGSEEASRLAHTQETGGSSPSPATNSTVNSGEP